MNKYIFNYEKVLIFIFLLFVISGCSEKTTETNLINVGVLPDHSIEKMLEKYVPLFDYIKSESGINYNLIYPVNYEELLNMFKEGTVDLVLFGGVTYVKASIDYGALPLVSRDVDGRFSSVVLARKDIKAKNIEELKGVSFAFGSKLSTSGHFMPRHYFKEKNILPEEHFSRVSYAGRHDTTAEWVRDGKVDAGVANSNIIARMFNDGRLTKDMVHVVWTSPIYSDYVWAIQPSLDDAMRVKLMDAFLGLDKSIESHAKILKKLGAGYYYPASNFDFHLLETIMLEQGL